MSNSNTIKDWVRHWWYILGFAVLVFVILKAFAPNSGGDSTIDIQLHDTYFVLGFYHASVLLTILGYCFFTFVYQFFVKWKNSVVNVSQLIVLGLFNLFLGWIVNIFWPSIETALHSQSNSEGWTVYPPLSAAPSEMQSSESLWYLPMIFWILFSLPLIYFLYCLYRTIKNHRTKI